VLEDCIVYFMQMTLSYWLVLSVTYGKVNRLRNDLQLRYSRGKVN